MLTPISFMKAILPGMIERKWGRVVNITSGSVKSPIGELGLSSAARSGLTGYVAGTARQVARYGVVINNLLPGLHETDRIQSLFEKASAARGISIQRARADAHAANPTGRFGTKRNSAPRQPFCVASTPVLSLLRTGFSTVGPLTRRWGDWQERPTSLDKHPSDIGRGMSCKSIAPR